ncbi:hypothetical protein [Piscinibacter sp.]|uniref:hypothetical protein n=1 Tax=Piscinibacter sp. TaxID=1903157 RepID=UPI00258FF841|nr:hypothetical protein [Piscinibacter sp.]
MVKHARPGPWPLLLVPALLAALPAPAQEDPQRYVRFVEEPAGDCVNRNGMQILVKNEHPTRRLRVWLDRYQAGVGTGDRSRSDLAPGAPPEPLGCSRNLAGAQEWRLARAVFLD